MEDREIDILLVDDEQDLLDIVEVFVNSLYKAKFVMAKSGNEAIEILKSGQKFDVVLCDYVMPNGNGGDVYKYMKSAKSEIPYVLLSSSSPNDLEEFADGGVTGYVNKPQIFEPLSKILGQIIGNSLSQSRTKEERFIPVKMSLIKKMEVAPVSFFVKLGATHAVKVIYKGSHLSQGDLARYESKGAKSLLFDVVETENFAKAFCDEALFSLDVNISKKDVKKAASFISQSTHLIRDLSNEVGWSSEVQQVIKKNVELALAIVNGDSKLESHLNRLFNEEEDYFGMHSAILSFITVAVAQEMGWHSEYTGVKLVLASLLHDISLTDHQIQTKSDLIVMVGSEKYKDVEDVISIEQHPIRAADSVRQIRGVPLGIDEVIIQHHERPDGSGFPFKISSSKISPLAALFIVVEDLVDEFLLLGPDDFSNKAFVASRKEAYFQGAFKEVLSAIERMC